jgi:TRAP-type C4-dicarboxylate transport system substrate-binding protein
MKQVFIRILYLSLIFFTVHTTLPGTGNAAGKKTVIKLGTLAPEGTGYHDAIMKMAQDWNIVSNGAIQVKVYAGGVAGSELDMIRKMKIGQLQAASLSCLSILKIDPAYFSLQVPGFISLYEELDYCRERMAPVIEKRLEDKGYVLLNYADFGYIYFFTSEKVTSLDELMREKICAYAYDQDMKDIWQEIGFNVVDLSANDILTALQTGLIDGFINAPVFALSLQWFGKAKYMVGINYGILLGATVIKKQVWDDFGPELQAELKKCSFAATEDVRNNLRLLDEKSIGEMTKYGLEVLKVPDRENGLWLEPTQKAYPLIRDKLIPAEIFDQALQIRNEYRKNRKK